MAAKGVARQLEVGALVPGTRYRVVGHLGRGGMGCVYEVEQVELGRRFVLKALLPEHATRADLVARLRQEWRALGQLRHPGIVEATDAGVSADGAPYFVMELLTGETLRAKLRRERRLGAGEAIAIAIEVLEALAAAHDLGVVHRDVKPANVFMVGPRRIKLLDFGIAKLAVGGVTITARGVTLGTPRYLSPEQARGEPVDGRTDLYAVGLLLFEMLTGRGPFDEDRDPNALFLAHLTRIAPRLDVFLPGAEPRLVDLVARLLSKPPSERPAAARTVASALRGLAPTPAAGWNGPDEDGVLTQAMATAVAMRAHGAPCPTEVISLPGARARDSRCLVTERIPVGQGGEGSLARALVSLASPEDPTLVPGTIPASSGAWARRGVALGGAADEQTFVLDAADLPIADPTHTAVRPGRGGPIAAGPKAAWAAALVPAQRIPATAAIALLVTFLGVASLALGWWMGGRGDAGAAPRGPMVPASRSLSVE